MGIANRKYFQNHSLASQSKKEDKDQESIQSSPTPDPRLAGWIFVIDPLSTNNGLGLLNTIKFNIYVKDNTFPVVPEWLKSNRTWHCKNSK